MKTTTFIATAVVGITLFTGCQCKNKQQPAVQQQAAENVQNNNTIPTFTMSDINGRQVAIKDEIVKNKITIIDFWASWCGPCMQEAPNIVAIYNDYHAQGLGIVGISLDNDEKAWKEAVANKQMNWTQLSDLKVDNQAAKLFNINAIPYTVIVDNKGNILATDLRGDELRTFVAEQLKKHIAAQ